MLREWWARLRDWLRRDQLEVELAEELEFHRRQLAAAASDAGHDGEESRRHAAGRLGNLTRIRDDARARWSWPWLDHTLRDLRHALRSLRRSPGFTAAAVLTLALGIGANAAMFGIVDRLMLRPFPMLRNAERVHRVYFQYRSRDTERTNTWTEYTRYLDLQRWTGSFERFAAFFPTDRAVGQGEAAVERPVATVSASYFDFFDAPPALGRYFTAQEDSIPVGADVVVLSYPFWQAEFGGRNVLGQTLLVGTIRSTIIGVTPPGFVGATEGAAPALYFPITTFGASINPDTYFRDYEWGWMQIMVARKPGVSLEAASADLTQAFHRSWNAERELAPDLPALELAQPRALAGSMKTAAGPAPELEAQTLVWVLGVAAIVLLIACANVANLLLVRALRRRREIALRRALGVSRARLAAQALTESLLLAGFGCGVGLLLAQWGISLLGREVLGAGADLSLGTDWRTIGTAVVVSLVAAGLTGLVPVLFGGRADLATTLKAGAREGTYQRSRARSALLVTQAALSVVLLVGAGLFVSSLTRVRDLRLGYDADRILVATAICEGTRLEPAELVSLGERLLETAERVARRRGGDAREQRPVLEHLQLRSSCPGSTRSAPDASPPAGQRRLFRGDRHPDPPRPPLRAGRSRRRARRGGGERWPRCSGPATTRWASASASGRTRCPATVIGIAEGRPEQSDSSRPEAPLLRPPLPVSSDARRVHPGPHDGVDPRIWRIRCASRALQPLMPGNGCVHLTDAGLISHQRRSWRVGADDVRRPRVPGAPGGEHRALRRDRLHGGAAASRAGGAGGDGRASAASPPAGAVPGSGLRGGRGGDRKRPGAARGPLDRAPALSAVGHGREGVRHGGGGAARGDGGGQLVPRPTRVALRSEQRAPRRVSGAAIRTRPAARRCGSPAAGTVR
ncbi:MAG: ABC transporter permease [Gemmatimonadales bacterium]